jgi:ribosomal protein S18 acetylase RimI-like enzyme
MIRRAEKKDIPAVLRLLSQVLEIHAAARPDIFISGTTKYTESELATLFADGGTPVYVAADEADSVLGYVFCIVKEPTASNNLVPFRTLYIDDLCVDESVRGQHIGEELFRYAVSEAKRLGCYDVTLNVWEGNDNAKRFYEKMGLRTKKTELELVL